MIEVAFERDARSGFHEWSGAMEAISGRPYLTSSSSRTSRTRIAAAKCASNPPMGSRRPEAISRPTHCLAIFARTEDTLGPDRPPSVRRQMGSLSRARIATTYRVTRRRSKRPVSECTDFVSSWTLLGSRVMRCDIKGQRGGPVKRMNHLSRSGWLQLANHIVEIATDELGLGAC